MPGLYAWIFNEHFHHNIQDSNGSIIHDTNCSDGVQWIYTLLGDCVTDTRGILSDAFGILSIVCWLVVGIPQMIKNCRNIRGIEGVSILLILQWTLGDTTNLIGSILTKQLVLQIYLAIYFVFADMVLFSQYVYYQIWKRRQKKAELQRKADTPPLVLCFMGGFLGVNILGGLLSLVPVPRVGPDQNWHMVHHSSGRNLLAYDLGHIEIFHNITDELGYAVGVISSIFYIGSRLAQIYKNYKLQSTEGLSLLMFWLAILGNLAYGLSILVRDIEATFVIRHLPWLVGSLGVIFLDVTLVLQFRFYRRSDFDHLSRQPLIDQEVIVSPSPYAEYETIQER